jgi:hypothetical protein
MSNFRRPHFVPFVCFCSSVAASKSKFKNVKNSLFQSISKHFKDKKLPAVKSPNPLSLTPRFSEVDHQNANSAAVSTASRAIWRAGKEK